MIIWTCSTHWWPPDVTHVLPFRAQKDYVIVLLCTSVVTCAFYWRLLHGPGCSITILGMHLLVNKCKHGLLNLLDLVLSALNVCTPLLATTVTTPEWTKPSLTQNKGNWSWHTGNSVRMRGKWVDSEERVFWHQTVNLCTYSSSVAYHLNHLHDALWVCNLLNMATQYTGI